MSRQHLYKHLFIYITYYTFVILQGPELVDISNWPSLEASATTIEVCKYLLKYLLLSILSRALEMEWTIIEIRMFVCISVLKVFLLDPGFTREGSYVITHVR